MSGTDKTNPGWVRALREEFTAQPHHCRACLRGKVECNLPDKPKTHADFDASRGGLTRRDWRDNCWWNWWPFDRERQDFVNPCGCWLCTGHYERKKDRRGLRHRKRKDIADRLAD